MDHSDITQSTGQAITLHSMVSEVSPQALPTNAASTVMLRVLVWDPPPHVLVHAENSDHSDKTQSTGHGPELHFTTSDEAPHDAPPFSEEIWIVRDLVD